MITLRGISTVYRIKNPMTHITVSLHDMNSYLRLVLVNRFQFFSSSAWNLDVTSSSIIALINSVASYNWSKALETSGAQKPVH